MLWRNIRFSSLLLIKWASLGQLFSVVEHQCPRIIVFSIFSYIFFASLYLKKIRVSSSLKEQTFRGQQCSFVLVNTCDRSYERNRQKLTASSTIFFSFRHV